MWARKSLDGTDFFVAPILVELCNNLKANTVSEIKPVKWLKEPDAQVVEKIISAFPATPPAITSQGFATCGVAAISVPVNATAPVDPKLPLNSHGVPMVSGTATLVCP